MNEHSDRSRLRKDESTDKNCRSNRKKRIEIKSGSIEVDERWIDKQKNGSTRAKKMDRQTKNWIEPKKMDRDRSGSKYRNRIDGRKSWIEPEILIEIVSLNGSKFDFYLNIKLSCLTFNLLEKVQFRKQAPFVFNENGA